MTEAQHTDLWASILAEAPTLPRNASVAFHHPVRLDGVVYTLREETDGCAGCVANYSIMSVIRNAPEYERRKALCTALPNCNAGIFVPFEPSDFALMVARGDSDG